MKGSDLVFAKAWSEIAVGSPVVLPWDRSCWKHVVAGKSLVSLKPAVFKRSLPPTVLHESLPEVQPDKKHRSQGVSATSWIQVVKAGSEDNWTELRDAQFQTALKRWLDVLLQLPGSCLIVVQLNQFGSVTEQLRMLRDVFAKKAPQTLLKRCHSFLRFVCNLKETGEIFPGTEHGLHFFVQTTGCRCPYVKFAEHYTGFELCTTCVGFARTLDGHDVEKVHRGGRCPQRWT